MAADPNPALSAELQAAHTLLEPQLRGLQDLARLPVSQGLLAKVEEQFSVRHSRQMLIEGVQEALAQVVSAEERLEADGYPALPAVDIIESLIEELRGELTDVTAAVAIFATFPQAASVTVKLGEPIPKTKS